MGIVYAPTIDAFWFFRDLNTIVNLGTDPVTIGTVLIGSVTSTDDGAFRFASAAGTGIPQYSLIGKATLSVKAYTDVSWADYWNITAAQGDIRSVSPYDGDGPLTTAYTHWPVPNPFTAGVIYDIDVKAVIQELVNELAIGTKLNKFTFLVVEAGTAGWWNVYGAATLSIEYAPPIAGQSSFTGTLTRFRDIQGTIAGQSNVSALSGSPTCMRRLSGGMECISTVNGKLRKVLVGTIAGQAGFTAALTRPAKLAGTANGSGTFTGSLTSPRAMTGTVVGRSWFGEGYPPFIGPIQMQAGSVYQGGADSAGVYQGGADSAGVYQGGADSGKVLPG